MFAAETGRLIAKVWTKVFPPNSFDRSFMLSFPPNSSDVSFKLATSLCLIGPPIILLSASRLPDKTNLVKIGKFNCFHQMSMMMEEKLCLKWNEFQGNVISSFGELRGDQDFTDVTLACEDRQFEAHKLILSTCSPFFRKLLKKTNKQQHPLVYMRGLKAKDMESVLDFIYQGETNILQEDLDGFLLIAEELQLKGLVGDEEKPLTATKDPKMKVKTLSENINKIQREETTHCEPDHRQFEDYGTLVSTGSQGKRLVPMAIDEDVARSVDGMIVKQDNVWTCTVCHFKSMNRGHLKEHVETHIEGLEYPCNYCGKIMRSSASLRIHLRKFH